MALIESLRDVVVGLRFFMDLPFFMRRRLNSAQARKVINERAANRGILFLDTCRRAIKGGSPYARLFEWAGCTLGDIEELVKSVGLDQALRKLYSQGVYLTGEEFKAQRPVVRGSASFMVQPDQLRNPEAAYHIPTLTGRSRGQGTAVLNDMENFWESAPNSLVSLDVHGRHKWAQSHWQVPGSGVLGRIVEMNMIGLPPKRWFSQVDPIPAGLHPRYEWSEKIFIWGSRLGGVKIPTPQFVSMQDLTPITDWLFGVLARGKTPHVYTTVSSAVRLCLFALEKDIPLAGTFFTVLGEAVTKARVDVFKKAGVQFVARYSSMEAGLMGFNCHHSSAPDDMHVIRDRVALIQAGTGQTASGLPPKSLLVTTLTTRNPFDFINFSTGDQADMQQMDCGCPLEGIGWSPHIKNIRSFEKLTGGGITFLDYDLIRVLEEVLPQRFGGAPTDYQMVEDEDSDGLPVLRLLVRPSLGEMNPDEVERVFLNALSHGGGAQKVAAEQWRDGQVLKLERRDPIMTPAAKILHLHQSKT